MRSSAPTVEPKLLAAFEADPDRPGVAIATGPDFADRVSDFLDALSQMERSSIRAVLMTDTDYDPWAAAPVDRVLGRLASGWFPDLMNTGALRFDFQPIVDATTLRPHGHEALVRGAGRFAPYNPGQIIAAAKAHDALLKFDQASRRAAILSGFPKLDGNERLFVNFLPLTIYDPEVCLRTTFEAIDAAGADISRIVFEVVESEDFPHVDHLRAILDAYRARGALVGLDDVGSGNTSILFIDTIQPDYVKLDRELIARAVRYRQQAIITGIVNHVRSRGIEVIAEGIETAEELDFARSLGAEYVQGYHISRPAAEPVRTTSALRAA